MLDSVCGDVTQSNDGRGPVVSDAFSDQQVSPPLSVACVLGSDG